MTAYDINLLTKEEKQEQIQTKVVKFSAIFSVALFVIVAILSGYFFYSAKKLESKIAAEDAKIANLRGSIQEMSSVEISARNLYQRFSAIDNIFTSRVFYSFLLEHFNSKVPAGVTLDSFGFTGSNEISISGEAPNYLAVSEFLRNLNMQENPQVFTSALLTSITLNSANGTVKYAIVINYDVEALKNK